MKLQPEPSAVLSQLTQRQQPSSILSTTESLGLSQSHAPQVPTPPGKGADHYFYFFLIFYSMLNYEKDLVLNWLQKDFFPVEWSHTILKFLYGEDIMFIITLNFKVFTSFRL